MPTCEPRNPFYALLLLSSLVFVITALAIGFMPSVERWAAGAGGPPAPTEFKRLLHEHGWKWLLYESGAVGVFGVLSMVLDRVRSWRKEKTAAVSSTDASPPSPSWHGPNNH